MIYVMYEIDHVLVIGITTCMSMSMTTGRSHRSCLNYCMTCVSLNNAMLLLYFIAKPLAIVVEVIVGETTS